MSSYTMHCMSCESKSTKIICSTCVDNHVCHKKKCQNKTANYVVFNWNFVVRRFINPKFVDYCEHHGKYSMPESSKYKSVFHTDRTHMDFSKKGKISSIINFKADEKMNNRTDLYVKVSSLDQGKILIDKYPSKKTLKKDLSNYCCVCHDNLMWDNLLVFKRGGKDSWKFIDGSICKECYIERAHTYCNFPPEKVDLFLKAPDELHKWAQKIVNVFSGWMSCGCDSCCNERYLFRFVSIDDKKKLLSNLPKIFFPKNNEEIDD